MEEEREEDATYREKGATRGDDGGSVSTGNRTTCIVNTVTMMGQLDTTDLRYFTAVTSTVTVAA